MSYWTLTKTTLAIASIGILLEPTLRRLGYLPPAQPGKKPAIGKAGDSAVVSRLGNRRKAKELGSSNDSGDGAIHH